MSDKVKAPAYLWYPKDYLADANTVLMTLEEEGAYRRLLDYCWLEGSIPGDMRAMGRLCKGLNADEMSEVWKAIEPCFRKRGNRWVHPRLEIEKKKQRANREAKSKAGKLGSEARWGKGKNGTAIDVPMAKNAFTIASTVTTTKKTNTSVKKMEYSDEFTEVWKCHAKGPKRKAFDEYKKAIKNQLVSHKEMVTALQAYVQAFQGDFTGVHLFRWIRDERWDEAPQRSGLSKTNIIVGGKEIVR